MSHMGSVSSVKVSLGAEHALFRAGTLSAWCLPAREVLIYRMPSRFAWGPWLNLFGSEMRTAETYYRERKRQVAGVLGMHGSG